MKARRLSVHRDGPVQRFALPVLLALAAPTAPVHAQLCAQLNGPAYVVDFNTLAVSGSSNNSSTLPIGFAYSEAGSGNITYAADDGSLATGNTYSYGTAGNADRALGELTTGTLQSTIGACFVNNTGLPIPAFTVGYTGEQWRLGAADAVLDRLDFQYSTNATSLNVGTWTDVNSMDFVTPNNTGVGAKNGNAAANRTVLSTTITFASPLQVGSTFFVRWVPSNIAGPNDGLAIDDFSLGQRVATKTWDGGGANNNWLTPANWDNNAIPEAGSDLVFPNGTPADSRTNNNDYPAGTTFRSIRIEGLNYDIQGNFVVLQGGDFGGSGTGVYFNTPAAGPQDTHSILRTQVKLGFNQQIVNNGAAPGRLEAINLNGFSLTIDGTSNINVTGAVTGTGSIQKRGPAKLVLSGTGNNYTFPTTVVEGTVEIHDATSLGTTGLGTTVQTGATLLLTNNVQGVAEPVTFSGDGVGGAGAIQVDSSPAGCLMSGPITLSGNGLIGVEAGSSLTLSGGIGAGLQLTKAGGGTLILGGSNSYSGGTLLKSGTLRVNGTILNTLTGDAGTLSGTGTTGAITATALTIAPGASAGTLTTTGGVSLASQSTFQVELGGLSPGNQYDRLVVGGGVASLGGAQLAVSFINGFIPAPGDTFTIIQSPAGVSGTFAQGTALTVGVTEFVVAYNPTSVALTALGPPVLVHFTVVRGTGAQSNLRIIHADGTAGLGAMVRLERSPDLQFWTNGAVALADPGTGAWTLDTTEPVGALKQFYRFRRL